MPRLKTPMVLMYHAIGPLPDGCDFLQRALFVQPETFARQMDYLARKGYRTLGLDEYSAAIHGRISSRRRFLLTFDDGYAHVGEFVTPVLSRHGYSAVMFVPWLHLGGLNTWDRAHPDLSSLRIMTADQIKAFDDSSQWEVASHGAQHVDLRAQEPEVRRHQLREARDGLSALLGRDIQALAYPYGYQDVHVRQDARTAGFQFAFTATGYGPPDHFRIPRRPITSWDRGALFRLRAAPSLAWLYRVEDASRAALKLRHLYRRQRSNHID